LGAREGLPQAVDRAGETCNLLGQPLCVVLLRGKNALYGLQLILNNLQLVDGLLLRHIEVLGFLNELLLGLCSPGL